MDQPTFDLTHRASRAAAHRVMRARAPARPACDADWLRACCAAHTSHLFTRLVVSVALWVAGGIVLLPGASQAQEAGGPIVIPGSG